VPAWIEALVAEFAIRVEEFTTALPQAPAVLAGHESDQAREMFMTVQGGAGQLDVLVAARCTIGNARGEAGAHRANLWTVAVPPPLDRGPGFRDAWRDLMFSVNEYPDKQLAATPVERWKLLAGMGLELRLARFQEIEARAEHYAALASAAAAVNLGRGRDELARTMDHADRTYQRVAVVVA
jgi:hypothetical protein